MFLFVCVSILYVVAAIACVFFQPATPPKKAVHTRPERKPRQLPSLSIPQSAAERRRGDLRRHRQDAEFWEAKCHRMQNEEVVRDNERESEHSTRMRALNDREEAANEAIKKNEKVQKRWAEISTEYFELQRKVNEYENSTHIRQLERDLEATETKAQEAELDRQATHTKLTTAQQQAEQSDTDAQNAREQTTKAELESQNAQEKTKKAESESQNAQEKTKKAESESQIAREKTQDAELARDAACKELEELKAESKNAQETAQRAESAAKDEIQKLKEASKQAQEELKIESQNAQETTQRVESAARDEIQKLIEALRQAQEEAKKASEQAKFTLENSNLHEQLKDQASHIESMRTEGRQLVETNKDLHKKLTELKQTNTDARDALKAQNENLVASGRAQQALQNEVNSLKQQLQQAQAHQASAPLPASIPQGQQPNQANGIHSELQKLQNIIENLERRNLGLGAEIEDLHKAQGEAQNAERKAKSRATAASKQVTNLIREKTLWEVDKSSMEKKIRKMADNVNDLAELNKQLMQERATSRAKASLDPNIDPRLQ